jgi:hypothetical protein
MRRSLKSSVCAAALLAALPLMVADFVPTQVSAAPVPYVNSPMDTPQGLVNTAVASVNSGLPGTAVPVTCSGNTTGTCNGLRFTDSVTNLTTTAGGNLSALVTVTDTSVTASSQALCTVENYAGNGTAGVANITDNAGNITFNVQNTTAAGGAALSATVPVVCFIQN